MKKLLDKLLPFLGITFVVAGLVVGFLTGQWATEAITLLVSGIASIVLWLLLFVGREYSFWSKRTTRAGTNALVASAAVIVILGLVNFLSIRYSQRLDFTENQLYTLAPETQEVVRNIRQPLGIYIFDRQISEDDRSLLNNYQRYNPLFKFEFVDPDKQINLTEQFKVKSLGEVYIKYGEKKKLVQSLKLGENLSEIQLTNAIVQVQRDRPQSIYFLQGHGEVKLDDSEGGFSEAVNALKAKGYLVETLNLIQKKTIPDNADAIVIAGAKRKLFPAEITTIKNYLDRGGKLLLTLELNVETGLESILREWGVQSENFLVIDASGTGQYLGYGVDTSVVGSYGDHPIVKDFADGLSVYPQSRPLNITQTKDIEAIPLVLTSAETWAESNLEEAELSFDPTQDIPGPLDLAVALTRKSNPTPKTQSSPTPSPTPKDLENSTQDRKITPSPSPSPKPKLSPSPSVKPTVSPQSFYDDREKNTSIILVNYLAQNTPKPTPTEKLTPTPKATPTPTSTTTAKPTTTPTVTPTATDKPTATPSPTPTTTENSTPKATSTPAATEKPTTTPSPSPTPTTTEKPTPTPTSSPTIDNSGNNRQTAAKMVVFGNTTFASNGWFQQQLNSDVFINSVNWLTDDGSKTLSIRPKQQKNRRINLQPTQAAMLTWLAVLIVPLLGLAIAIIMWWRRR